MATKYYDLKGKCKWAKVFKPDQKYQKYSIDLCPDVDSRKVIDGLGLKSGFKADASGDEYITFRRDPDQTIFVGKDTRGPAGGPKVLGVDPNTDIGNGSDVTLRVAVYSYDNKFGKGVGSRLEVVNVTNLVPYNQNGETSLDSPF